MPRGKFDRNKLKPAGEYFMEPAISSKVEQMIRVADQEIAETRVNFRWGKEQLDLVKRAAEIMGVPYQTYIKQVVYRQCLQDLKTTAEVRESSAHWAKSERYFLSTLFSGALVAGKSLTINLCPLFLFYQADRYFSN
jgi:hypothetical protein